MKKECKKCKKIIDIKKDKYVLMGTYDGKKVMDEGYFHWQCFKDHWEERVRIQAKNIVDNMQKKIVPVAKNILQRYMGN